MSSLSHEFLGHFSVVLSVTVYFLKLLLVEGECCCSLFCEKGNSSLKAKGQRWEAQWDAERGAGTGGDMFEHSESLPTQASRQAASGEVRTDWRISQVFVLAICEQKKHRMPDATARFLGTFSKKCCKNYFVVERTVHGPPGTIIRKLYVFYCGVLCGVFIVR